MQTTFYKRGNKLKSFVKELFFDNKKLTLIIFVAVLLGVLVAILLTINNHEQLGIENILNKKMISLICDEISVINFFLTQLLKILFIVSLITLCCYINFYIPIYFVIIAYWCFTLFFDFILLTICFNLIGFLFGLFFIIIEVLLLFIIILFMLNCYKQSCSKNNCKNNNVIKNAIIVFLLCLIVLILKTIIINIFSPFIVIII